MKVYKYKAPIFVNDSIKYKIPFDSKILSTIGFDVYVEHNTNPLSSKKSSTLELISIYTGEEVDLPNFQYLNSIKSDNSEFVYHIYGRIL